MRIKKNNTPTNAVFIGLCPSLFKRNHLGFEYLDPFYHQPCVKWHWIWNESTLHLLGLGWCHMHIWILFSWLIMISFKPLTYLCPNSRIKWEKLCAFIFHSCSDELEADPLPPATMLPVCFNGDGLEQESLSGSYCG